VDLLCLGPIWCMGAMDAGARAVTGRWVCHFAAVPWTFSVPGFSRMDVLAVKCRPMVRGPRCRTAEVTGSHRGCDRLAGASA